MQATAKRILDGTVSIEKALAFLTFAVMLSALLADVLGRELFGQGVFGSVRVAVYGLIICAMAGFGIATATNSHLRPKFMDGLFRGALERPAIRFGQLVSAAILFFLTYAAWEMVAFTRLIDEHDTALNIIVWPMQLALPIGFALSGLRHVVFAILPDLIPEEGNVAE